MICENCGKELERDTTHFFGGSMLPTPGRCEVVNAVRGGCPAWADGVHCFLENARSDLSGYISRRAFGAVKSCACGVRVEGMK